MHVKWGRERERDFKEDTGQIIHEGLALVVSSQSRFTTLACAPSKPQEHRFRVPYHWLCILQNRATQSCQGTGVAKQMRTWWQTHLDWALFHLHKLGPRAATAKMNVIKNPKRTHMHVAMTGWVVHSSWLGVLLHLDDDFSTDFGTTALDRYFI